MSFKKLIFRVKAVQFSTRNTFRAGVRAFSLPRTGRPRAQAKNEISWNRLCERHCVESSLGFSVFEQEIDICVPGYSCGTDMARIWHR